ncbi:hypothetical protein K438DRAFT_1748120 [Mycena galopus ATCC 62051]|nr:hypothetical protein K438DRAFT_1748120 [Mycena galopus ATCC 62051]
MSVPLARRNPAPEHLCLILATPLSLHFFCVCSLSSRLRKDGRSQEEVTRVRCAVIRSYGIAPRACPTATAAAVALWLAFWHAGGQGAMADNSGSNSLNEDTENVVPDDVSQNSRHLDPLLNLPQWYTQHSAIRSGLLRGRLHSFLDPKVVLAGSLLPRAEAIVT